MDQNWQNLIFEIALFILLGTLYYFYQKKKILRADEKRIPLILEFVFQSCLKEKKDEAETELDMLIEEIHDFLHHTKDQIPTHLMKTYMESSHCSEDLKEVILEALSEIEQLHGKK